MSTTAESIFEQALTLSAEERLNLFHRLEESLYPSPPPSEELPHDLRDEEKATLDRRWKEITSGKVKCRDAFEVLEEIRARHHV